jgi:hypothetical protein
MRDRSIRIESIWVHRRVPIAAMIYVITLMIVGSFYFLSIFVRSPTTNMLRTHARTHVLRGALSCRMHRGHARVEH